MNLIPDIEQNYPWMLSSYGSNLALGFKGTPDFIARCFNWAVNTGVVGPGGQLIWYYEAETGRLAYICPKSLRAIKRGLYLQFQAEIILGKEVPVKKDRSKDEEWHENPEGDLLEFHDWQIARLAGKRVKMFMKNHIVKDSFFLRFPESVGNVFGLASRGRADAWEE